MALQPSPESDPQISSRHYPSALSSSATLCNATSLPDTPTPHKRPLGAAPAYSTRNGATVASEDEHSDRGGKHDDHRDADGHSSQSRAGLISDHVSIIRDKQECQQQERRKNPVDDRCPI
jgi:hypothetical protein